MGPIRKRFGQHFLEPAWVEKVIDAIDPKGNEIFLEIGPGRGALTRPLAARSTHVVAVEIDRDLARGLRASHLSNVTVVEDDFLALPLDRVTNDLAGFDRDAPRRVAGNLPYNVASPILFRLVELSAGGLPFTDATVMLQHEVAARLTAKPGTKEYGVLSVLIGHSASVERVLTLPPGAFRPAPQVRSAVVRLRFHAPNPPVRRPELFAELVQAVFTRRRKTLGNALGALARPTSVTPANALIQIGLDPKRRPETLTIGEFAALADALG